MKGVNYKQEMFIQEFLKGKSQREAYIAVYNPNGKSDKDIEKAALRLIKNPRVAERINELSSSKKALWNKEQAVSDLINIKNKCIDAMAVTAVEKGTGEEVGTVDIKIAGMALSAIKELNILSGFSENNIKMQFDKVVVVDDI